MKMAASAVPVVALEYLPLTAILTCAPSFCRTRIRVSFSLPNCTLVESNNFFESSRLLRRCPSVRTDVHDELLTVISSACMVTMRGACSHTLYCRLA